METIDTVQQFESHLLADGKAKKTIQSYLADVKAFHRYLGATKGTVLVAGKVPSSAPE